MYKKKSFLALFLLIPLSVHSEYRVYQYFVKTKIQNLANSKPEIVTSTLNPVSFIAYHGGKETIEASLLRSWQCMGDTSKQQPCSISDGKEFEVQPQGKNP